LEAHHSIIRCSRHKRDRRLLAADRAQVSRWNLRTDQKFQNFKPPVIRISGIGRAEALSYWRATPKWGCWRPATVMPDGNESICRSG
jgi:hypothetical protein